MSARLNPYLQFAGQAREAMELYAAVLGGELTVTTYGEGGMPAPEGEEGRLMHAQLAGPDGLLLMAADSVSSAPQAAPGGFSVSLSGDDDALLRSWWAGLSEGATIQEPLEVAPWGDAFGMLVDRFGVPWMINIAGPAAA